MIKAFKVNVESAGWHVFRIVRTFIVVNIGWYFDRILDFGDCMQGFYNTLFNFAPGQFMTVFHDLGIRDVKYCLALAAIGCLVVFVVSVLRERGVDVEGAILKQNWIVRFGIYAFVVLLTLGAFMFAPVDGGFMYANF